MSEPTAQADTSDLMARTLARLGAVPVQPGPLLRVLQSPPDDPAAVGSAIAKSPALAARVLGVTNSAGVGLSRQIDCVRRAVIHLGAGRARLIALAFGLRMLTEGSGLSSEITHPLWVNSLRKAAAARRAAALIAPQHTDRAFTLGLLQDLGLPMLMAVDPAFYHHELLPSAQGGSWSQQEVRRFGIDHAAVGARLLQQWDTSSRLTDAVADHHRLPEGEGDETLARLPGFIASLLPHLAEPSTPAEHDWMVALHAQFLAEEYASPDAFIQAAAQEAAPMHGGRARPPRLDASRVAQITRALSNDTEAMVLQLCQLEDAVGKQREHLSHLRFQAFTDQLTKVLNRRGFMSLAQRRVEDAVCAKASICMLVIDLDGFKPVNDRFGHEAGDLVLRGVAKLLRRSLDRADLVGRLGGDEFAVLITHVQEARAREIATRIANACRTTRVRIGSNQTVPMQMSVGAAYCDTPDCDISVEALIAAADEAMYERKHGGKGGVVFRRYAPCHAER